MGLLASPPSPASQWLQRLDHRLTPEPEEEEDYEMEVEEEQQEQEASAEHKDVPAFPPPNADSAQPRLFAWDAPAMPTIDDAIENASPHALRKLVRMMVHSQQASMDLATAYLLKESHAIPGYMPTQRKRKAYETCQYCRTEFEPGNNREECCNHHPGKAVS